MPLKPPEILVEEESSSTGTGNFTLLNKNARRPFSTAFGTGDTNLFQYFIVHRTEDEWEYGHGYMSDSDTLVRETVLKSSNTDSAVDFSAGTKDVVNDYVPTMQDAAAAGFTLGTPVATTSGTSFNYTGIPAGTKMIIMSFEDVSLSATDNLLIQIGDSGGLETTGYVSTASTIGSLSGTTSSTSGFIIRMSGGARRLNGHVVLTLLDAATFTWDATHAASTGTGSTVLGGGTKSLSAELDRISLLPTGANNFNLGKINIKYIG